VFSWGNRPPHSVKAEQVTHASVQRLDHKFVSLKIGTLQAKLRMFLFFLTNAITDDWEKQVKSERVRGSFVKKGADTATKINIWTLSKLKDEECSHFSC
jgi:hypothetical protein